MNYLQKKKLAFMSIVNRVKGIVRTVTGVLPLTLTNCVDEKSIIDYTLYGQSVQNGTPTPETPIEVESVGEYDETTGKYKIPIKVSGKNLLSPQKWVSGQHSDGIIAYPNVNYITSMGENYIEANLTAWQGVASEKFEYAKFNTVGFKINKNQVVDDYTIYYIGLQGYDVDGKKTAFKQLSTSVVADKEYVFKKNNGSFEFGLSTTSVRLCILSRSQAITGLRVYDFYSTNDAETGYEPYHEPITTNIYLDEPLRKIGDYADYIDFENGKVVRNVKDIRLNKCTGTYTWIGKKGVTFNSALDKNYDHRKGLCNRNSRCTANGDENITMWLGVSSRVIYWIGILDYLGLTTVTEMNEWLTNNPTYVFYGTDIPTEIPITLPTIPTFKGTSIITADTTIQPSNAEITYYSSLKE